MHREFRAWQHVHVRNEDAPTVISCAHFKDNRSLWPSLGQALFVFRRPIPGRKGILYEIQKNGEKKRGSYVYYYGKDEKVTITPGKDGVTELDIKLLHSLDDHEVYINIKNSRPKMEEQEKAAIKEWEEAHAGEVAPRNWNISIEAFNGEDGTSKDKSKVLEAAYYSLQEEVSPEVERLRDVVETLTPEQQELYQMVIIQSMTLTEAAKILGTSIPNIHKRMNRIYEQIKKKF